MVYWLKGSTGEKLTINNVCWLTIYCFVTENTNIDADDWATQLENIKVNSKITSELGKMHSEDDCVEKFLRFCEKNNGFVIN